MELAQAHFLQPVDVADVEAVLREILRPELLNPWGALGVAAVGPWRPADVWPDAPELLVWSLAFHTPGDALLSEAGVQRLGAGTIARRGAPVQVVEHVVGRLGHGLVLLHSDAGRYGYVAVYRERHLRSSLMLVDGERIVRCDGVQVMVESPPRELPEQDRAGVLLAGLERLFLESLPLRPRARIFLVEDLDQVTASAEIEWLIQSGAWTASSGLARASG